MDLVSDMHLSPGTPRTARAFIDYLLGTPADAVLILGDLFEVWVGDDARCDPWERALLDRFAEAARRIALGFMVGNRDFLAGPALRAAAGFQPLPDPTAIQLFGQRVLLSHGDALCVADAPYQVFRRQVRSEQWQSDFLARPLAQRRQIAAQIRSASRTRQQFDGAASADVDAAQALSWLQSAQATVMVHGHTHRPGEHKLDPAGRARRVVLSDWDLDDPIRPRAQVLSWTAQGFERLDLH